MELGVADKYEVSHFAELGNGPFLRFLAEQERLREELGAGLVGAGADVALNKLKRKVLAIMSQLDTKLREDEVRK